MSKGEIGPTDFTLRFKHGRTTILLFVEPHASFSSVKASLLSTLRERYPDGLTPPPPPPTNLPTELLAPGEKIPIPTSVGDVVLGVPTDAFDISKGWTEIDTRGAALLSESPKTLGLKDGNMIAFYFTNDEDAEPEFWVEFSNVDELYPEDDPEQEEE